MSNTILKRINPRVQTGFNKHYACKNDVISPLVTTLNNTTFFENLDYLFKDPSQFFVSLKVYPFDVSKFYYGNATAPTGSLYLGSNQIPNATGVLFPDGTYYHHMGTYTIPRKYNNYLDYAPYTKLEIYLPFVGVINLDTNVVMGKEIRIFLSIDFDTGQGTYWIVKHESDQGEREGDLIQSSNTQIGFEIPLGSSNANENAKTMLASAITLVGGVVTSIATENPLPLIMGGLNFGKSIGMLQERISKGCNGSGKSALVSPSNIYIIRTTNIPSCDQLSYASVKGLPLNQVRRLGDLSGFTIVSNFHLENFNNTLKQELDKISTLLKTGVII